MRWGRSVFSSSVVSALALACALGGLTACDDDDDSGSSGSPSTAADAGGGDDGAGDPLQVTIASGKLQGVMDGDTRSFLGIPYAKPPVGDLRWKEPQPVEKWSDTRDATQFGKRCAQLESTTLQNAASDDEDCLYLNVWTRAKAGEKLPVMFWIHGGGNVNGSASEPVPFANSGVFYSGKSLAENHGVVVVTFNYRLGVFGFFPHPALAGGDHGSGNQGLLDQVAAMQWVKDNIEKFGGDPKNVTIFGESAGSLDTCFHVASPKSRGLFQRAISESGGCTTHLTARADAESAATEFAKSVGCDGDDALKCLRGKSVSELLNAGAGSDPTAPRGFGPDVDGNFMPDQPRALFDAGDIAKVPYILGSNSDEGTLFLTGTPAIDSQDALDAAMKSRFGAAADAVAQQYPVSQFQDGMPNQYQAAFARAVGDSTLVCSTFDSAQRAAKAGNKVFMYNFDIPVEIDGLPYYLGASHGSELVYVFNTSPAFTPEQQPISDLIERYWSNFAKNGDPNGGDDLKWPAFTDSTNVRINLSTMPSIVNDFRAKECAFWQQAYTMMF
jgi:para-nitrobenzyl esterase